MEKEKKDLKSLSRQIINLEKKLELGENIEENQQKIKDIMSTLTLEELFEIDDYIMINDSIHHNK